jgi:hypothetical protein
VQAHPLSADSVNTIGKDQEGMLCCGLHHPMQADTHTQQPTWRTKEEERLFSGEQAVGDFSLLQGLQGLQIKAFSQEVRLLA